MSFDVFQSVLNAVVSDIGEPTLHPVVAKHAMNCLEAEVRAARRLPSYGRLDYGTWWTTCSSAEFQAGAVRTRTTLLINRSALAAPPTAEVYWRGTILRVRANHLRAEGSRYGIGAGRISGGRWRYSRTLRRDVEGWEAYMDKDFLTAAGKAYGTGKDNVHASTEETAAKALRRMVKQYLGVELVVL